MRFSKMFICFLVSATAAILTLPTAAEVVWRMNFDAPAEEFFEVYPPGPGDIPADIYAHLGPPDVAYDSWSDSHAMMGPPDILTPEIPGPQGGNALYTDPTDGEVHEGLYISSLNGLEIDGSFTAESLFYVFGLNPDGDEYGLQDLINTERLSDAPDPPSLKWDLRIWPLDNPTIKGHGQVQFMTAGPTGEHSVDDPDQIELEVWHHAAAVYDADTNTAILYIDGEEIGTVTPDLHGTYQNDWSIGSWMNQAASSRSLFGFTDAVAVSDEVLEPGSFVLAPGADVDDWAIR